MARSPRSSVAERSATQRLSKLARALERVRAKTEVAERIAKDPVSFVHRYRDPADREIVAVLASSLAFGNVKAFSPKIEDALRRLGPTPARTADDPKRVGELLRGWKHRLYVGEDLASLIVGARSLQRERGSLGEALTERFTASSGDLGAAASDFAREIRARGGLDRRKSAGAKHIFVSPDGGSAAKRLMLLFRWMVRGNDGIDVGDWALPTEALVIPLDVHLHRLSKNLGLTKKRAASWAAALEVTRALAEIDPRDPVKYDFPLCHLGMVQGCPSSRDPKRCQGCGVKPVCIHWERP